MAVNITSEKKAYLFFREYGMSMWGAIGLIANMEAESDGFYPWRLEYLCEQRLREDGIKDKNGCYYTQKSYTEALVNGDISCEEFLHPLPGKQYGYGLCQWTSPGRKAGLWSLAKRKGVPISDEDMQLEYLIYELENNYAGVLKVLKTAATLREASDKVLVDFESPKDTGESVRKSRAARGQIFYDTYVRTGDLGVTEEQEEKSVHYISNCGHDEKNGYKGGSAGDQTGGEWALIPWYPRPWNCVIRHPDAAVRQMHADMAKAAALNNNIGYDQNQRDSFGVELKAVNYEPAKITKKCETDCSKGAIDIAKAIGHLLDIPELQNLKATYTGNMRQYFAEAGYDILTDAKYLNSPDYLLPGDILLNDQHHTATNITQGSKASSAGTSDSNLQKGSEGSAVKIMQQMLIKCGYSCGKAGADGDFGEATDAALRAFQKATGLTVDGVYGPKSKAALDAEYKKVAEADEKKTAEPSEKVSSGVAGKCTVELKTFLIGARDPQVKTIQILLNAKGFKGKNGNELAEDGELGENTAYAIEQLQRKNAMKDINFGTVASKTWNLLLN